MVLSKSDYLKFLISPAYLWLHKHDPKKLPPNSEADLFRFAEGNEIDKLAQKLFKNGTQIKGGFNDGIDQTKQILDRANGSEIVFQPAVLTKRGMYAREDVLINHDNKWNLYEVKSATKVKPDYIDDLAFQKIAFEEAGYQIGRVFIIYINRQYERSGEIEPKKLLKRREVTKRVEANLKRTRERIPEALSVLEASRCPDDGPMTCGNLRKWMPIYRHLHPDLGPESIYKMIWLDLAQLKRLHRAKIDLIADIPLKFKLHSKQRRQVELVKLGRPALHKLKIKHRLAKLDHPIYFLDYETFGPAIPLFDGQRPYQHLPFQYSLDVLKTAESSLEHKEFLATTPDNPVPKLLQQLKQDLGPTGSVMVWNKWFEGGCNDAMAALYPDYKGFLEGVNVRLFDLMEIFADSLYAHPDFYGSNSIKAVLPVLVPEMNYKDLGISEGMTASIKWQQAARGLLKPDQAKQVYSDLLKYCGQDTLAMVKIYQFLLELDQAVKI